MLDINHSELSHQGYYMQHIENKVAALNQAVKRIDVAEVKKQLE